MFIAADVNQNAMLAEMLGWILTLIGVACVVLRAVSEQVRRGVAADILTAAAVVTGSYYCSICAFFFSLSSGLHTLGVLLLLFAAVGWRFPLRVCRKAFCGTKSRRGKRVKYYLTASLLRAPWVLWVLLGAVGNLSVSCMSRETGVQFFMLMRWGHLLVLIPVILCLVRLFRKHQTEAARRCLIISVAVFFLS